MHHSRFGLAVAVALTFVLAVSTTPAALSAQAPAPPPPPQAPAAPAAPAALTPEQAKPFMGEWTISAESPQGPMSMALSLKDTAGKVAGQISSDMMPLQTITDITKAGESLVLRYALDFNGTAVPVVITLTGGGEALKAVFDFADGQFSMNGTGTKKKP